MKRNYKGNRFTGEEKSAVIEAKGKEGFSPRELSGALGISKGAILTWGKIYREEGRAGLERKRSIGPTAINLWQ